MIYLVAVCAFLVGVVVGFGTAVRGVAWLVKTGRRS